MGSRSGQARPKLQSDSSLGLSSLCFGKNQVRVTSESLGLEDSEVDRHWDPASFKEFDTGLLPALL